MDLSPTTTVSSFSDEKLWLGSKHGTDCPFSITLDIDGGTFDDLIVADESRVGGYGYIPSGVALVETATPNLYEVATGADTPADGHLYAAVFVKTGTTKAGASLLWHGVVIAAQVPGTFDVAENAAAANILYR